MIRLAYEYYAITASIELIVIVTQHHNELKISIKFNLLPTPLKKLISV